MNGSQPPKPDSLCQASVELSFQTPVTTGDLKAAAEFDLVEVVVQP
jgi:GDP-D-mannose dehydratase